MATSNVHIGALADSNLAQIFKGLPPFDRLRVSEVCRRWWSVSRDPWREITHLELTSIPSQSVGAIVKKCPNLSSLFCKHQQLILDDLKDITLASFKSLELHGCSFVSHDNSTNRTALPLFRSDCGQSVEALSLHGHNFGMECSLSERYSQRLLPTSLKRLQLSGLSTQTTFEQPFNSYLLEMGNLRNLECLLLHVRDFCYFSISSENSIQHALLSSSLGNLRELFFPSVNFVWERGQFLASLAFSLAKLEVLVLPAAFHGADDFLDIFVRHPTLRILVLAGHPRGGRFHVPRRSRFSNGFAAEPLPLLHVFVSGWAAKLFRFDASPANWLRVHPIDAPFPELLDREEIAEIFGGSWIAKQIKEGAKRGMKFWTYEDGLVDSA